jgi:hypothetical protein
MERILSSLDNLAGWRYSLDPTAGTIANDCATMIINSPSKLAARAVVVFFEKSMIHRMIATFFSE